MISWFSFSIIVINMMMLLVILLKTHYNIVNVKLSNSQLNKWFITSEKFIYTSLSWICAYTLSLPAAASAGDASIIKKDSCFWKLWFYNFSSGNYSIGNLNEVVEDIMKLVTFLSKAGILIKGITKIIENEVDLLVCYLLL